MCLAAVVRRVYAAGVALLYLRSRGAGDLESILVMCSQRWFLLSRLWYVFRSPENRGYASRSICRAASIAVWDSVLRYPLHFLSYDAIWSCCSRRPTGRGLTSLHRLVAVRCWKLVGNDLNTRWAAVTYVARARWNHRHRYRAVKVLSCVFCLGVPAAASTLH